MATLEVKPPIRTRAGSVTFANITLVSKAHYVEPRNKQGRHHSRSNDNLDVKQSLDSFSKERRSNSFSLQKEQTNESIKFNQTKNHTNRQTNEEPQRNGYLSPQVPRHSIKRNSLSLSLYSRTNKSLSLPDGKIITHLHGRNRTEEGSDSEAATPTQNKKIKLKSQKSMDRRKMLYRKFQLYARITMFCRREANSHILRNKAYDEISPYLNSLTFFEFAAGEDNDLMFDISKFKADKQLRISEETKRILGKPTYQRTDKELRYAQIALRNISSFAEYPVRMQRRIVAVGRYEKYDSKRVIVRQGHPASAFYFILSGSVVIMVYEGDTKVAKPVAYMKKGQTFGELAIIHRTARQSTVVAKEIIELLSIDIEDFHNIFMAGGVKNITDPDHNVFLRGLPLLRTWPIERMLDNPDKCVFHYFKRGEVLVKDSHYSDWIFIVKSGSLQVLKKLKRVEAYESNNEDAGKEFKNERQKREEREQRAKQRRYILPDINIPLCAPIENEHLEILLPHPKLQPITDAYGSTGNITNRLQEITCRNSTKLPSVTDEKANLSHPMQSRHLPPIHRSGTFHTSRSDAWLEMPREPTVLHLESSSHGNLSNLIAMSVTEINVQTTNQENTMKNIKTKNSSHFGKLPGITFQEAKDETTNQSDTTSNQSTPKRKRAKQTSKQNSLAQMTIIDDEDEKQYEELVDQTNNIRTITQDLDSNYYSKDPDDFTEADLDPQFVHIQTLTKGQVFGISELVLGQQTSFCLVSSGAECVMLNKDFYMGHASEALLRTLRLELSPYPSDKDMQKELQATIDWEAFKNTTFKSTLQYLGNVKGVPKT